MTHWLCAIVAGSALAYAVDEGRRIAAGRVARLVSRGQAIRRILGALVVVALMVLVYAGLEVIDPFTDANRFVFVWTVSCGLVVLLLALAALDVRELRANRDIERARQLFKFSDELSRSTRDRSSDESDR